MDRNTLSGLLLIGVILIGYSWWNSPSDEEVAALQQKRDSIEQVQALAAEEEAKALSLEAEEERNQVVEADSLVADSVVEEVNKTKYGLFATAARGDEDIVKLENDKIEVLLFTKGGKPVQVRLKEYTSGW